MPGASGVEHLAQVDSRHFLGAGQWLGPRVDFHCTAVGKVFLAFGARRLPARPLAALTPATITDRRGCAPSSRRVRARAASPTAVDELEAGLAAIAAPVRGARGDVVAALEHLGTDAADDARADRASSSRS